MMRVVAFVVALAVVASGSGIPMCASLLAHAAEPCAMHEHTRGHGATSMAGHTDDACHTDAAPSCAGGGTCAAGGTAVALQGTSILPTSGPTRTIPPAIERQYSSFVSTPLPHPPQI